MGRVFASVLALLAAIALPDLGCSRDLTSPTSPSAARREVFSGELTRLSASSHPFTVSTAGPIDVSISSLGPIETMAVGVGIGTWDGATCSTLEANANARQGTLALSGTALRGRYCLQVFDSGNLAGPVTYTVQVVHY